ncbi:hypothetical protein HDU93_005879 [Gonapodya sp. JEL0774]|nr:hypothetical protein HDU93_005879 [Gonapodya sp. JEL0774]
MAAQLYGTFTSVALRTSVNVTNYLTAKFPEAFMFAAVAAIVDMMIVVPGAIFFTACDNMKWFQKYKILQGKRPSWELERKGKAAPRLSHIDQISSLLKMVNEILVYYIFYGWNGMKLTELPTLTEALPRLLLGMVIADVYAYWYHRTVHEYPFLYKNLHKEHHEFNVSSVYACFYGGDVEGFFQTLPLWLVPCVLKMTYVEWLLMSKVIMEMININMHCGYNLPFMPFNSWPFISAGFHNFHHSHNSGAYSLIYFRFWDDVFGQTDGGYYAWERERAEGKKVSDMVVKEE